MLRIYTTYDCQNSTWNAMLGTECLFYGTIDQLEDWLVEHKNKYREEKPNERNKDS
jgi:hypothetical protein